MIRKNVAAMLTAILLSAGISFHSTHAQSLSSSAQSAKAKVADLGTRSKVEVKLSDGTKAKGRIGEINDQTFTVTDQKTGATQEINYNEVTSLKKSGEGVSPLTWGLIGGAAAAAVIVGVTVVKPVLCDGGAGC